MKKCGQAVGPDPDISILEDFMTEQLYEHENHELVRTASDRMEEFLIAPQYLLAKFPVAFLLEPNRCLLGNNVIYWTESWPSQVWAAPATYGRTVPLSNSLAGYLS